LGLHYNSEFLNQPSNDPFNWRELELRAANLSGSFIELILVSAEASFPKFGLNYAAGSERQSPDHDLRHPALRLRSLPPQNDGSV
jgi:hypothetical protein